ncbi:hypothetical protein [Actinomycetospora flava]|uniref:Uncharacterized protein n=1 Tax=Actinomycetospora flava TaxID=3129232 RepID=A0ABU8LYC2_9PSEU
MSSMLAELQPKDVLTLALSAFAVVVSLIGFAERRSQAKRASRARLSELIDELNQLDIAQDQARQDVQSANLSRRSSDSRMAQSGLYDQHHDGAVYNARRELLIQQSEVILATLPDRWITSSEYRTLALALKEWGDRDAEQRYWAKAIRRARSTSSLDALAIVLRGYGLSLLDDPRRREDGRKAIAASLAASQKISQQVQAREREVETLEMWLDAESSDLHEPNEEIKKRLDVARDQLNKIVEEQHPAQISSIPERLFDGGTPTLSDVIREARRRHDNQPKD